MFLFPIPSPYPPIVSNHAILSLLQSSKTLTSFLYNFNHSLNSREKNNSEFINSKQND